MFTTTKKKHHKQKRKTLKKIQCNPSNKTDLHLPQTCMKKNTLQVIKDAFNQQYPDKMIKTSNPKTVWNELKIKLTQCEREDCWLDLIHDEFIREDLKKELFAPFQPSDWKQNPVMWLTNHDILKVLEQYEGVRSDFKFIGPTPIDFNNTPLYYYGKCVCQELCKMNIDRYLSEGINHVGIVFNLDKHDSSGSHWVSMYIDLKNKDVYYFDSNGIKPPKEVEQLIQDLQKKKQFKVHINELEHQLQNTECGMYSLYFIITMLTEKLGKKSKNRRDIFQHMQRVRLPDSKMKKLREKYFNK